MPSKIKKIFFTGVFGILYASFIAQLVYGLTILFGGNLDTGFIVLGLLSAQWLVLVAARYLSKKSASGRDNHNGGGGYHNNYRR